MNYSFSRAQKIEPAIKILSPISNVFLLQLINNPKVLILDEPTTGLDSYIGGLVVDRLMELAQKGYTIICTIHQPSSDVFVKFDKYVERHYFKP